MNLRSLCSCREPLVLSIVHRPIEIPWSEGPNEGLLANGRNSSSSKTLNFITVL